ncbi:hypothetical protein SAMN04487970_10992 [Paenibacillus tianmuensis]|uniref:DoxX-like family protein n=1 Tax=Paenibacillus tianmuensis TaxID=624147 RepID=A0A1G4U424_9BACL|nr:hypothetical protein [Paenibacillus tianmuensis]SCW87665.1 hypothetical protein SAMN04487970_10992 [Paenibacillus tianmuensis]
MNRKRPLGVALIGSFYIFGSVVLWLSLFLIDFSSEKYGIAARFGLPNVPEHLARILVGVVSLVMAYGYLRLKRWGYWLMVSYSIYFLTVSGYLFVLYKDQPFLGNVIWSLIVIAYSYSKRSHFYTKPQQIWVGDKSV